MLPCGEGAVYGSLHEAELDKAEAREFPRCMRILLVLSVRDNSISKSNVLNHTSFSGFFSNQLISTLEVAIRNERFVCCCHRFQNLGISLGMHTYNRIYSFMV